MIVTHFREIDMTPHYKLLLLVFHFHIATVHFQRLYHTHGLSISSTTLAESLSLTHCLIPSLDACGDVISPMPMHSEGIHSREKNSRYNEIEPMPLSAFDLEKLATAAPKVRLQHTIQLITYAFGNVIAKEIVCHNKSIILDRIIYQHGVVPTQTWRFRCGMEPKIGRKGHTARRRETLLKKVYDTY
ncbi:unnamed protein product [Albugo candida]|uniref:Uncharacterized protein n=1 Tax=Albugo candida TaxID=65357 RepID=A0A024GGT2_9STRA|nr:unnamed protein product [Albugo candida]|eukprot:CCI45550.1 unnamed protein product [Albugo candida]